MSSLVSGSWQNEMQNVASAINGAFGEALTIIPMITKPNFSPVVDPTKKPATLTGVFSLRTIEAFKLHDAQGMQRAGMTTVTTRHPLISFALKDLPYPILRLYRIRRERDGAVYEVTDVQSDGVSRVLLHLVQAGVAPDAASEGNTIRESLDETPANKRLFVQQVMKKGPPR